VNDLVHYESYGYATFLLIRWRWDLPIPGCRTDVITVAEGYGIPYVASAAASSLGAARPMRPLAVPMGFRPGGPILAIANTGLKYPSYWLRRIGPAEGDGDAMRIIRIWNRKPIIMNVCRRCGIGAGKTLYPGGSCSSTHSPNYGMTSATTAGSIYVKPSTGSVSMSRSPVRGCSHCHPFYCPRDFLAGLRIPIPLVP
jgi:hypothetical protein